MNRLVRIALTLFASATILIILVWRRLESAKTLDEVADARLIEDETRMALLGLGIAGALAAAGFVLIIASVRKTRRKALSDHG